MRNSILMFVLISSIFFYSGCSKKNENSNGNPVVPSNTGPWTQVNGLSNFTTIINNGANLFAGGNSGVYLSTDNGINWVQRDSGLKYLPVNSLAVYQNETSGTEIIAGTENGGVFLSSNNGTTWQLANSGLPFLPVTCFAVRDSFLFAGVNGGGMFLSTNNGLNWSAKDNGLGRFITIWCIAEIGQNLYVGTPYGVYLSNNNGNNWALADSGMIFYRGYSPWVGVLAVSSESIYAGVIGGNIFQSINNGISWKCIRYGQRSEVNSSTSLAVSDSTIFVGTNSGVFLSTNKGTSWSNITDNLSSALIEALSTCNKYLFVETSDGKVWRRSL